MAKRWNRSRKLHIETSPETVGTVVEMFGGRRGKMVDMVNSRTGSVI